MKTAAIRIHEAALADADAAIRAAGIDVSHTDAGIVRPGVVAFRAFGEYAEALRAIDIIIASAGCHYAAAGSAYRARGRSYKRNGAAIVMFDIG